MARAKMMTKQESSESEAGVTRSRFREVTKAPTRTEKLSGDPLFIIRWQFREAMDAFPHEPRMRYVDKYYPYAEGGPLLIDEPQLPHQIAECERKAKVLREHGYRYVILMPQANEAQDREALANVDNH